MKAKSDVNRVYSVRLLLTQEERNMLEQWAHEHTGNNMSEYVRRVVFVAHGKANSELEQSKGA